MKQITDMLRRTADMAVALGITPKTVRNHIQRLLEKLGAHSRLQALGSRSRRAALGPLHRCFIEPRLA